jgi:RecB family exonuclease
MKFLQKIVNDIADKGIDTGRLAVITPNRRAGLFIKKYIQENPKIAKPAWLPQLFSIQDFVSTASDTDVPDKLELVFRLYQSYSGCFKNPKSFDAYYPLSHIILSDFEEIDLALADREKLFALLKNISLLETSGRAETAVMKSYSQFAENMSDLYRLFTDDLLKSNQACYGLALRRLIDAFDPALFEKWEKIIFAGFYALTKAEQKIIELLTECGKADIYWDMDQYYFADSDQEAGYFFRENRLIQKSRDVKWMHDDFAEIPKNIKITGAAGRTAQAKLLGHFLLESHDADETAIVLPDESMLFPVLHSIPDFYKKMNVTMGYPLKNTSMFRLLKALIDLHKNRLNPEQPFHYKDISRILLHPYILPMDEEKIRGFLENAKTNNSVLMKPEQISCFDPRVNHIFRGISSPDDFIRYMQEILKSIADFLKEADHFPCEIEYVFQFYTQMQEMADLIHSYPVPLALQTLWNLMIEIAQTASVPFLGEPLEGLQIMGLLETRTLDFKNVYIMSANEGVLPAGKSQNSFIPNDARREFGMNTWAHRDSIYAYYFYRLIQRAQNVTIFYNTESGAFGNGEKSRFIDQLLHEYCRKSGTESGKPSVYSIKPVFEETKKIRVQKNDEMLRKISAMRFSPTMLQTYVDCGLKFYLQYCAGLRETEELLEYADAREFGSVIHLALEKLYAPLINKKINDSDILNMKKIFKQIIREAYLEKLGSADISRGRNYLYCRIIETLIENYINNEKSGRTILDTEKGFYRAFDYAGMTLKLYGKADMIISDHDAVDIIDFKTGKISSLHFDIHADYSAEMLFEALEKKPQVLQLLLYYYLVSGSNEPYASSHFRIGVYSFKEQKEAGSIKYLSPDKNGFYLFDSSEAHEKTERILRIMLDDLFSKNRDFTQTEDTDKCGYCPYKKLCGRPLHS